MTPAIEQLLGDLRIAVAADHRHRRRRARIALAVLAALLCTTGVGIAGTVEDWWTNAPPPVHSEAVNRDIEENSIGVITPDPSRKATVATTDDAALVAVATKSGGYCLIPSLDDKPEIGNSCTSQADDMFGAYASPPEAKAPHWIAYGRIVDTKAAALDLRGFGLAEVPLRRGGFFLFDVPRDRWTSLDGGHGQIAVLDAQGGVLGTGCLWLGPAPGSRGSGDGWGMIGDAPASCDLKVPEPVVVDVAKAKQLVTLALTRPFGIFKAGETIAVWRAPSTDGKPCTFTARADAQPTWMQGTNPVNAPRCGVTPIAAISVSWGLTLVRDHYDALANGTVDAAAGIVELRLESPSGSTPVAFAHGAFIVELPSAPREGRGAGPIAGGPYAIVGYDAGGTRVASVSVGG